ncbi:O-methyltransferase [Granulibacter bethesdensis]|nr:O-methyltransferase [Granulibacter bethesdensis]
MQNKNNPRMITKMMERFPLISEVIHRIRNTELKLNKNQDLILENQRKIELISNQLINTNDENKISLDNFKSEIDHLKHKNKALQLEIDDIKQKILTQSPKKDKESPLPKNQYILHTPERYGTNLSKYIAEGGLFSPERLVSSDCYSDGDMVRFFSFIMFFDILIAENITGDLLELGVWKGDTAVLLADFARKRNVTAWLLDTFEGFDQRDLAENEDHLSAAFKDTSLAAVRKRIGEESVRYIQGYFPDTANQLLSDNQYSFVHIDCDLYAPILSALEYFYPRMVEGGFIVMHDFMSLTWEGPTRAINEFFADKPEKIIPVADFAGTVVVRKLG